MCSARTRDCMQYKEKDNKVEDNDDSNNNDDKI